MCQWGLAIAEQSDRLDSEPRSENAQKVEPLIWGNQEC